MKTLPALVISAALLIPGSIAAKQQYPDYPWRPWQVQCTQESLQSCPGANCNGWWPLWAECTVEHAWPGAYPQEAITSCIEAVTDDRDRRNVSNAGGDPVADVVGCLQASGH